MARIAGVDLPRDKRVEVGLTYIFGIGRKTSNNILASAGINPDTRIKDLTEEEVNNLRKIIDADHNVEGDLRREVSLNIKRLKEIRCYRGLINKGTNKGTKLFALLRIFPLSKSAPRAI